MPNILVKGQHVALSSNGTSDGYATVADNTLFPVGAIVIISSSTVDGIVCTVTDLVGTTKVGLHNNASLSYYGRTDLSAYLTANTAALDMEEQVVPQDFAVAATSSGGGGGYSTIQVNGSGLTQRSILNFSSAFTGVDSGGTKTNIGLGTGDILTQYAYLAGRAGGQAFVGGTAAGDDLAIRATSNGSPSGAEINIGITGTTKINVGSPTAATKFFGNAEMASGFVLGFGGSAAPTANVIPITVTLCYINTGIDGQNHTLADGAVAGQELTMIVDSTSGGPCNITPATTAPHSSYAHVVLNSGSSWCTLKWDPGVGWAIKAWSGGTFS